MLVMATVEVGAQLGPLLAQLAGLALSNWKLSLPGLLWMGLYWILFQLARWTPPPRTNRPNPLERQPRYGKPSVADRLFEARRRALLSCRRIDAGLYRTSEGGCTRHGYNKRFPFKFRDPSYQTSHRGAAPLRFDLQILHELAELVRRMLRTIRKATSGAGEGAHPPLAPKSTPTPPPTPKPKPRRRTKPKRTKNRR
jgi:hypothetical protein